MTMVALRINLTDCHRRVLTMLRLTLLSDTQLLLQTPGPAEARTCVLEAPHADTESYRFTQVTEEISARDDPECEKERPYGDRLRVFRGTMLQESTGKELKVVFKVAYDEPCLLLLANEAEIYTEHLVKVQGEYVPRMYGSFVGETDEGKTRVTVLEDWGEELRIPLKVQPVKFRCDLSHSHDRRATLNHFTRLPGCWLSKLFWKFIVELTWCITTSPTVTSSSRPLPLGIGQCSSTSPRRYCIQTNA